MKRLILTLFVMTALYSGLVVRNVRANDLKNGRATLTVSSVADSGADTLREALTTAAHGDTIDFSISGTISLASDLPDIDKRLTIDGTGQTVMLQGDTGIRSGFTLIDGANLTVRRLTFDGGDLTTGFTNGRNNGAAIYAKGSVVTATFPIKLTVENSTFTNNNATAVNNNNTNSRGGAIFLDRTHASISNSIFEDNSVSQGVAVNAPPYGGAIYADESVLLVDNSTFHDNVAGKSGGAIYVTSVAEFEVHDSTFTSNDANGTGFSDGGGAIHINSLQNGSATQVSGVPSVITGSYFGFNTSDSDGGAIRIQPRGVTIHNSTFYQNTAGDTGGGIYAWGAQISHITAASNTAADKGGGVFLIFSDTRVDNSILGNNTPDDCAASSSDFILIRDSLVRRNSPEVEGETDYNCNVESANGNIQNTSLRLDTPTNNGGPTFTMKLQNEGGFQDSPAIDAANPATCSVADQRGRLRAGGLCDMGAYELNSTVNCAAHDGTTEYISADSSALQNAINSATNGGSVKVAGTCLGGSTIDGTIQTAYINKSLTLQGGYHPISWTATANPTQFITTLDADGIGRVIRIKGGHTVDINGLTLQNGVATGSGFSGRGAGIYQEDDGTLELNQLIVQDNVSVTGAGLYLSPDSSVDITDSTFNQNTATSDGAGVYASNAFLTVKTSLFSNNAAVNIGGALSLNGSTKTSIENSTISGNRALRSAAIRQIGGSTEATLNQVTVANNEGNPAFVDTVIGNVGVMTITNSILAYAVGGDDCTSLAPGVTTVLNTLVMDESCGVTNNLDGNKTGDPQLFPLVFDNYRGSSELDENGALTRTHVPKASSGVIGGGSSTYCTFTDQIGFSRPMSGPCDMGAREYVEVVVPTAVAVSGQLVVSSEQWGGLMFLTVLLSCTVVVIRQRRLICKAC